MGRRKHWPQLRREDIIGRSSLGVALDSNLWDIGIRGVPEEQHIFEADRADNEDLVIWAESREAVGSFQEESSPSRPSVLAGCLVFDDKVVMAVKVCLQVWLSRRISDFERQDIGFYAAFCA